MARESIASQMKNTAKNAKGSTSKRAVLQTGGTQYTYKGKNVSESKFYRNANPDYRGGFNGQNDGRKD